jgi:hypothetical protein
LPYRPGLLQSAEQTLDQIAGIKTTYSPDRPFSFLSDFIRQAGKQPKDVFILSDFQQSPSGISLSDSVHKVRLLAIESTESANAYIDSLFLESPFLIEGAQNALKVQVKNSGNQASANLVVRLLVNGEPQGSASLQLESNSMEELSFPLSADFENNSKVSIELDDYPNTYDNEFFGVLQFSPRFQVVLIEGEDTPPYLSSVFGNQSLFELDMYPSGNVDYGKLVTAELVVLNQLPTLPSALADALNNRMREGKTTLLIPANNPDMASYQALEGMPLIPLENPLSSTAFAVPDAENPFFRDVFSDLEQNIELPSASLSFRFDRQGQAIISLRNGLPFLMATGTRSSLLSMASSLDDFSTTLGRHALFVPLMYKMASIGRQNSNALYARNDAPFVSIEVPEASFETILTMRNDDLELIPEQRKVGSQILISFNDMALPPAFYTVDVEEKEQTVLAVNAGKGESVMEFLDSNALKTALSGLSDLEVFGSKDLTTFAAQLEARFTGTPLWKMMILLAMACLIAEILIIRLIR